MIERLKDASEWEEYVRFKMEKKHLSEEEEKRLTDFARERKYIPVVERIRRGDGFSIPEKKLIRKSGTAKKRVVYVFPEDESNVMKLFTFILLRKYDGFFADNLYSFRVNTGVNRAIWKMLELPDRGKKYTYKADISNYFNSIETEKMLECIENHLADDPEVIRIFRDLLSEPRVKYGGEIFAEKKGVMAGTACSVFLANLYLAELDHAMAQMGITYARYSDDIIVFADSEKEIEKYRTMIRSFIEEKGLIINEEKEILTSPGEPFSFLGICFRGSEADVSGVSLGKLKAKIRRRARAIKRWQVRKGASDEQAVRAFIRAMNRKFFENSTDGEMNWSRWYFPVLNTDKSLHEIDRYVQEWIRFLASGRHRKANGRFTYDDMKENGYLSLVNAYYTFRHSREDKLTVI